MFALILLMKLYMEAKPYLKSITIRKPEDRKRNFPFTIPAVRAINTLEFAADVTFLVGENGSGKSTILESIARVMNFGAQGGTAFSNSHGLSRCPYLLVRRERLPASGI